MVYGCADDAVANKLERQAVELLRNGDDGDLHLRRVIISLQRHKERKVIREGLRLGRLGMQSSEELRDDCLLRRCAGVQAREIGFGSCVIGDNVEGVFEVVSSRD